MVQDFCAGDPDNMIYFVLSRFTSARLFFANPSSIRGNIR